MYRFHDTWSLACGQILRSEVLHVSCKALLQMISLNMRKRLKMVMQGQTAPAVVILCCPASWLNCLKLKYSAACLSTLNSKLDS